VDRRLGRAKSSTMMKLAQGGSSTLIWSCRQDRAVPGLYQFSAQWRAPEPRAVYPGFGGPWQTWGDARLRIGLITDEFNQKGGGAGRWTAQFADHLLAVGHEVRAITFCAPGGRPGLLQMHMLRDPRSLYGRALAVEATVAGLGPRLPHDSGTGWSADVFHPHIGSRLLSTEQEIRSHIWWRPTACGGFAAAEPPTAGDDADRSPGPGSGTMRSCRVTATVGGTPPSGRARRHRHSERGGHGALRLRASGYALVCLTAAYNLRLKGIDTAFRRLLRHDGRRPRLAVVGGVPDTLWSEPLHRMGLQIRSPSMVMSRWPKRCPRSGGGACWLCGKSHRGHETRKTRLTIGASASGPKRRRSKT
jgi:hypothetical protein